VTDSASGMFGILEIWKVKIDWICSAVGRERKKCIKCGVRNCIGKRPVGA